jgi:hypothetical protein
MADLLRQDPWFAGPVRRAANAIERYRSGSMRRHQLFGKAASTDQRPTYSGPSCPSIPEFFAAQFSAGCTTNMPAFDFRQAQPVAPDKAWLKFWQENRAAAESLSARDGLSGRYLCAMNA